MMGNIFISTGVNTKNAIYLRKTFYVQEDVMNATIKLSALGIYKAYINGVELDEQVFLPGRTSYKYRVQYQEYEVRELIKKGENVLAIQLCSGWYKKIPMAYCNLKLSYLNGSVEHIMSDSSWKLKHNGPLEFNDMKLGEIYDARKDLGEWKLAGFDDSGWLDAVTSEYLGTLVETEGERILEHEQFAPVKVIHTPKGEKVLDFGQNIAGYMQFKVSGKSGHVVKMIYGETLDENGNFTVSNLNFTKNKKTGNLPQTVEYILKNGEQEYKPQASVHGFQFVKLENWTEEIKLENFTAIAVYSNLKQTGEFKCSNEKINKLISNIRWSTKSNFLDIPTDCPQRERAGWTGDIMVYSVPATYQMHTYKFLNKWMKDVILEQGRDGRICNIVPDGGMPTFMDGAAGWSDVIVKVPWVLYEFYGDKEVLEMAYPAMQKHIAFMEKRAKRRKLWNKTKGKHWNYLIDCGFHWGEWLEPGSSMPTSAMKGFIAPDVEVASAYYAWSTRKVAEISEILGKTTEAEKYHELSKKIIAAYRKEFLPKGIVNAKRQCRYVRPIALDLADPKYKEEIARDLNHAVIENQYHVGTGFLSTCHICNVLTEYGYTETAYKLIENQEKPGWLYEVNQGATSIWENWYGKDEEGKVKNSFNHYSPGAIVAWFYSRCAGIRAIEPGFKKILVEPKPGGTLKWAECSYESPVGKIVSNWKIVQGIYEFDITVPAPAEIILPNGDKYEVEAGKYKYSCKINTI